MPERRTLVVMLKAPRAGRVKTRLGREISMVGAAWWFRHQTRALLRRLRDPRWEIVLTVSPDFGPVPPDWPRDLRRVAQGRGDLGTRMIRGLRAGGPGPVCLIGGDVPGITRAAVAEAFAALGPAEVVFGPSHDGGFWLVGLRNGTRVPQGLFAGARFSTKYALADSVTSLRGVPHARVRTLRDVDTAADLAALRG